MFLIRSCSFFTVVLALSLSLLSCSSGVQFDPDGGKHLGSARVWYAVDPGDGVVGVNRGNRAKRLNLEFANRSHRDFVDGASLNVAIMDDDTMYAFLMSLKQAGFFSETGGTYIGAAHPVDYIEGLPSPPYKWIAVEHNGEHTLFVRAQTPPPQEESRTRCFRDCEDVVRYFSTMSYGSGSSGKGSGVPDEWNLGN